MDKVKENSKVTVHYIGTYNDGNEFDNSYRRTQPLVFTIGENSVISGFESAIMNRNKGEKIKVMIPSDQAYGDYSVDKIEEVGRDIITIPDDIPIGTQMQGTRPDGTMFLCSIKEIKENSILLDLNHPLAGKDLNFEIEILEVI